MKQTFFNKRLFFALASLVLCNQLNAMQHNAGNMFTTGQQLRENALRSPFDELIAIFDNALGQLDPHNQENTVADVNDILLIVQTVNNACKALIETLENNPDILNDFYQLQEVITAPKLAQLSKQFAQLRANIQTIQTTFPLVNLTSFDGQDAQQLLTQELTKLVRHQQYLEKTLHPEQEMEEEDETLAQIIIEPATERDKDIAQEINLEQNLQDNPELMALYRPAPLIQNNNNNNEINNNNIIIIEDKKLSDKKRKRNEQDDELASQQPNKCTVFEILESNENNQNQENVIELARIESADERACLAAELSDEIWVKIFEHINWEDFANLRGVCQYFKNLIDGDYSYYQTEAQFLKDWYQQEKNLYTDWQYNTSPQNMDNTMKAFIARFIVANSTNMLRYKTSTWLIPFLDLKHNFSTLQLHPTSVHIETDFENQHNRTPRFFYFQLPEDFMFEPFSQEKSKIFFKNFAFDMLDLAFPLMHCAARHGSASATKLLLSHENSDVNTPTVASLCDKFATNLNTNRTQAHELERGNLYRTYAIISNDNEEKGFTPLHFAILRGDIDTVKALLDCGANPNHKAQNTSYNIWQTTPLNLALYCHQHGSNRPFYTQAEAKAYSSPPTQEHYNTILLERPIYKQIITLLIQAGADVNMKKSECVAFDSIQSAGNAYSRTFPTPLEFAHKLHAPDLIVKLYEHGASFGDAENDVLLSALCKDFCHFDNEIDLESFERDEELREKFREKFKKFLENESSLSKLIAQETNLNRLFSFNGDNDPFDILDILTSWQNAKHDKERYFQYIKGDLLRDFLKPKVFWR